MTSRPSELTHLTNGNRPLINRIEVLAQNSSLWGRVLQLVVNEKKFQGVVVDGKKI